MKSLERLPFGSNTDLFRRDFDFLLWLSYLDQRGSWGRHTGLIKLTRLRFAESSVRKPSELSSRTLVKCPLLFERLLFGIDSSNGIDKEVTSTRLFRLKDRWV